MTRRSGGLAAVVAAALVVAGCTGGSDDGTPAPVDTVASGKLRLASFDSCDTALRDLRRALLPLVGPYGIGIGGVGDGRFAEDAAGANAAPGAGGAPAPAERSESAAPDQAAPEHSGTNTHEAGVDEPDLVKTDGKRIVTVAGGSLRVVDVGSRTIAATLALPQPGGNDDLLMFGDHALLIRRGGFAIAEPAVQPTPQPPTSGRQIAPVMSGSELLLVDLTGTPRVLATFAVDGRFVDARMVGQTVRVVTHSQPRLEFVYPATGRGEDEAQRMNRQVVESSSIEDWLPRYRLDQGGSVRSGRVDCAAVARPASYSATSMLTVLSFDLGAQSLGTGDPVTIVADGDTVYGTADSLYVASNSGWLGQPRGGPVPDGPARGEPVPGRGGPGGPVPPEPPQERTELYKFDISGTGRPQHVASGAVPGRLLNQYSMSQFDGHLRVATTAGEGLPGPAGSRGPQSESTVYVLAQRGNELAVVGKVGGLGRGERIYAVRFVGPVGYVVTFRQTDPLYTIDLRNPAAPRVAGELKITGYSAYLHPAGDGRVIGVGQEASEQGRVQGTQVSLFDVSDPAAPRRVAQYHLPGSSSEAEYNPHAFLYWPATATLVLPIASYRTENLGGAVVLRLGDGELVEVGTLRQPTPSGPQSIRRALVTGDTLWTISEFGAAAAGLATLDARGWVPFDR